MDDHHLSNITNLGKKTNDRKLLENCYSPRKLGFLRFSFGENSSAKQIMKLKLEIVTNLKILIKVRI
jgi:hypothetical protein